MGYTAIAIPERSRNIATFITKGSRCEACQLTFAGSCTFSQKIRSWDFDRGYYNIYKVLLSSCSGHHSAHDAVYSQENRIVETLVAPCLDKCGHSVTEGQAYGIHGLITRDDLCGTTWEFNPLLLDCRATRDQGLREDALQVMGCGQVKSVLKVMNPAAPTGSYHQILVNHQPTVSLV
ncbi:hypothetical protein PGT21_016395 [Puccinia graminis f. sp. tritici]|uniref:Uncharacterized protein n=1 Tax=Puccinia graminis f. sp. tritici TaxID=56615 RepID=A0A5B0Q625_PUCGR|nr:hypothetical protein PGT21_016395 [Puccinia graminis f. sp. tritici]